MQPILRQVPPKVPRLSMQALFSPSWPARMAALYPPGPPPMTTTSKLSLIHFSKFPPHRRSYILGENAARHVLPVRPTQIEIALVNGVGRRARAIERCAAGE